MTAFTVDFTATLTSSRTNPYVLSYAISASDNNVLGLAVTDHIINSLRATGLAAFTAFLNTPTRYTWVYNGATLNLYVNGTQHRTGTLASQTIAAGGVWVVGQEQDSLEGTFDDNQRFVGTICDLQMWDSALSDSDLQLLMNGNYPTKGNVFDWPPTYGYAVLNGTTYS